MRIIIDNKDGVVRVHKFFPFGGVVPTDIKVQPGEVVLMEVLPGEVNELARENELQTKENQ